MPWKLLTLEVNSGDAFFFSASWMHSDPRIPRNGGVMHLISLPVRLKLQDVLGWPRVNLSKVAWCLCALLVAVAEQPSIWPSQLRSSQCVQCYSFPDGHLAWHLTKSTVVHCANTWEGKHHSPNPANPHRRNENAEIPNNDKHEELN